MTNKELAQRFINTLNELLELDKEAIEVLFKNRVVCNQAMAGHPTVQVRQHDPGGQFEGDFTMSTLGLLNGLVGVQDDGWGYIAAAYDVICPECGQLVNGTINDNCPDCDIQLTLGALVGFELVDHS